MIGWEVNKEELSLAKYLSSETRYSGVHLQSQYTQTEEERSVQVQGQPELHVSSKLT